MEFTCTQYVAETRYYGYFDCTTCQRSWESANAWEKWGQMCRVCDTMVYPHLMMQLKDQFFADEFVLLHPREKCEMCMHLNLTTVS